MVVNRNKVMVNLKVGTVNRNKVADMVSHNKVLTNNRSKDSHLIIKVVLLPIITQAFHLLLILEEMKKPKTIYLSNIERN